MTLFYLQRSQGIQSEDLCGILNNTRSIKDYYGSTYLIIVIVRHV